MAEYYTANLGDTLRTAETIKAMRRAGEFDRLQQAYMGQRMQQSANEEKRTQQSHDAEMNAFKAKYKYLLAENAAKDPDPAGFIKRFAPELIQDFDAQYGKGAFEQMQPEQRLGLLNQIKGHAAAQAGIQEQPKGVSGALYKYVDANGNPVYGSAEQAVGQKPYESPRGNGISFTTPDGTEIQIGGDGVPNYGGTQLSKPTRTKLEDAFTNAQANSYSLREQLAKYRPEFSTLAGRLKAGVANAKDMAGIENAPQQQQYLQDFSSWKSETSSLLSSYLNQLSGAAISPHEEARLKAGFPNPDDGPTEYQSKAQATMRRFALAQARAAYLLSNPAQSLDSVSLDSMSEIITGEANRLAAALTKGGMNEADAKQRAIADTRARYGMQ